MDGEQFKTVMRSFVLEGKEYTTIEIGMRRAALYVTILTETVDVRPARHV